MSKTYISKSRYVCRKTNAQNYIFVSGTSSCGFPGAPAHSSVQFSDRAANAALAAATLGNSLAVDEGTIAEYTCDRGFELLGPARRVCGNNGTWSPQGIPFCGKFFYIFPSSKDFTFQRAIVNGLFDFNNLMGVIKDHQKTEAHF